MIVALTLLAYALLLSTVVPHLLRGARWTERAPRLAIATWQAVSATVVASVTMAGLALIVPAVMVSPDLATLLKACAMALREQFATPGGGVSGATGIVLSLATIGRSGWYLCAAAMRTLRERAEHRRVLDMVGRHDRVRGVVVLESDESAVYCLPGRRRRVVATTAALRALSEAQLDAVLAHERAHLVERHDLVVTSSVALAKAFAGIGLFRWAASETARLVELRADDVAAARTDRLTVAGALLAVVSRGGGHAPAVALGVGGEGAAARVRRLIPPRNPIGRVYALVGSITVVIILAIPLLVLGVPAAAQARLCADGPAYTLI